MAPPESTRVPTSSPRDGWSIETAIDHMLALMGAERLRIDLLFTANDKRYEQRFDASQKALEVGFAASKAAVDASFAAQKEAINAALAAADRAVTKAELATEKRFESVNEFRGTLDNQQRTLIPRSEVGVMVQGLEEKISNLTKLYDGMALQMRARDAEQKGVAGGWGYAVGLLGALMFLGSLTLIGLKFIGIGSGS